MKDETEQNAEQLRAEIAKLRARISEQDAQMDRADEHTAKIMAEIATMTESRDNWRASCKQVEGERDVAFVRGLERALGTIRPMVSHKVTDAIQAEIAKAGKP